MQHVEFVYLWFGLLPVINQHILQRINSEWRTTRSPVHLYWSNEKIVRFFFLLYTFC